VPVEQIYFKILLVILTLHASVSFSQPGALDLTFGNGGKTSLDFLGNNDEARDVLIQPDGKILVAGTCNINFENRFAVVRYTSNGTLDDTFDGDGKAEIQFGSTPLTFGSCMALQPDGKILLGGSSFVDNRWKIALARLNTDGSLDNTFSNDGLLTHIFGASDFCNAIALQPDGKIIIAGNSGSPVVGQHFSVFRFNSNGTIDPTFNTGSVSTYIGVESGALSVAVQNDGKIVLAGRTTDGVYSDAALLRYDANGVLDPTFDSDGIKTITLDPYEDYFTKVEALSNGKLLVGGVSNIEFALVRLNANGSLDNTFSGDGIIEADMNDSFDELYDFAIDANGKIVAAGHSLYNIYDIAVLRFNANGTFDNLFSLDGKTTTDFTATTDYGYAVALQPDGKIVVAGVTDASASGTLNDFAVVRYQGVCPLINVNQSISICEGESIQVGNSTYSTQGNYTTVITLPSGCDSIVSTALSVLPNFTVNQNLAINEGESITVGNNTYTSSGTYTDVFFASNGCDSTVITTLTVNTGIGKVSTSVSEITFWPSPFVNEINICQLEIGDWVILMDGIGREMIRTKTNSENLTLSATSLNPGVYFLIHKGQRSRSVLKVFKAN
jgi:uncharacterized delta-60 repeat protein